MLSALLLVLGQYAGQPGFQPGVPNIRGPIYSQPSLSAPLAFSEFAPASGRGMGAACACATITGAKSEVVTLTRASSGVCSKQGVATTGIANGDLVTCANDQPRVELTGGVLGIRVEESRTNSILRSDELDNASWSLANGGAPAPGNPTVTANAGTAPDGTATAERVDFPSTTGTGFSVVYNTLGRTSTAAAWTHSVYVRGVSGSGTIYLMSVTGATYISTPCAFVSTSWNRCRVTGTETAATWFTQIGFDLRDVGQTGQGAQSVFLWRAQDEAGPFATSPVATTTVAVTRAADAATLTLPVDRTETTICLAATIDPLWSASGDVPAFGTAVGWAAPMLSLLSFPAGAARFFTSAGTTGAFVSGRQRLIGRDNNTNVTLSINGTLTSAAAAGALDRWTTTMSIGSGGAGSVLNSIVSLVQADPDPTRCL